MKTRKRNTAISAATLTSHTELTMKTTLLFVLAFLAILFTPKAFGAETPAPATCVEAEYNNKVSTLKDSAADDAGFCANEDLIKSEITSLGCDGEKANKAFAAICSKPVASKPIETLAPPAKEVPAKKTVDAIIKLCRQASAVDGFYRTDDYLEYVRANAEKNLTNARSFKDDIADDDKLAFNNLSGSFTKVIEMVEKWKAEVRNATSSTLLDYNQCLRAMGVDPANAENIDKAAKELEAALAEQNALNGSSNAAAIQAAADKVKVKEAILAGTLLDNSQPMNCNGKDVEMKLWLESELSKIPATEAAPARKVLAEIKNSDPCQVVLTKVMTAAQALSDKWYNRLMLRQLFPAPGPTDKAVALVPDAKGTSYSVGPSGSKDGIEVVGNGIVGKSTGTGLTLGVGVGSFFQTGRNALGVTSASIQAAIIQAGWKIDVAKLFWIEPHAVGAVGLATGSHANNQGSTPVEKRVVGMLGGGAMIGFDKGIFSPYVVGQGFGINPGFSAGVGTLIRLTDAGALDVSLRWSQFDTEVLSGNRSPRIRTSGLGFTIGGKF